jgi:hypothetical protein
MKSWIRQFSLPDMLPNESVFDTIVTTHGVAIVSMLLDRFADEINEASSGLVEYLRSWSADPGLSLLAWDISFGRAQLALTELTINPVNIAVRLGLRIVENGYSGSWQADLSGIPVKIDRYVLEQVQHVNLSYISDQDSQTVGLRLIDGSLVELHHNLLDNTWAGISGEDLPYVGRNRKIYLMTRKALPFEDRGCDIFEECNPVDTITADREKSFHDGFSVLEMNTPHYIPWIERAIQGIVVCPRQTHYRLVSGSWEDVPCEE